MVTTDKWLEWLRFQQEIGTPQSVSPSNVWDKLSEASFIVKGKQPWCWFVFRWSLRWWHLVVAKVHWDHALLSKGVIIFMINPLKYYFIFGYYLGYPRCIKFHQVQWIITSSIYIPYNFINFFYNAFSSIKFNGPYINIYLSINKLLFFHWTPKWSIEYQCDISQ